MTNLCRLGLLIFALSSCQTPQVTFRSEQDVNLVSKPVGDFVNKGEALKSNEAITLESLKGKMVQVTVKNQPPYYWIFYPPEAANLDIKVDQPEFLKKNIQNPDEPVADTRNILPRLVFMSLRSLDQGDLKTAGALADQMSSMDPKLAMPWLVKALIKIDEGKKSDAVALLKRAKALDPGDAEIDRVIESLR